MDTKDVLRSLYFIKSVAIKDIASLKDSEITKTLNDLYFNDFDKIEEAIKELEKMQIKAQNPRTLRRFKIDLQPTNHKCSTHYTNHLVNYISFNIKSWTTWGRLPITITDTQTNKQLTIHANDWIGWKEKIYEWLGISKEVLEVI